jgi:hypothetical protein
MSARKASLPPHDKSAAGARQGDVMILVPQALLEGDVMMYAPTAYILSRPCIVQSRYYRRHYRTTHLISTIQLRALHLNTHTHARTHARTPTGAHAVLHSALLLLIK